MTDLASENHGLAEKVAEYIPAPDVPGMLGALYTHVWHGIKICSLSMRHQTSDKAD